MFGVDDAALIGGAAALGGALIGSGGAKKAAKATARAMDNQTTASNRQAYNAGVMGMLTGAPHMEASFSALAGMMDMMGLSRGITGGSEAGTGAGSTAGLDPAALSKIKTGLHANDSIRQAYYDLMSQIGTGSAALASKPAYDWQASPSYAWRLAEGQRAVESSLLTRGLAGSGAALRELTSYGQGMASQEYDQIFSRLATIAGFGPAGMQTTTAGTSQMSNLIGGNQAGMYSGIAQGQGYIGQANAWANAINQVGGVIGDWMANRQPRAPEAWTESGGMVHP